MLLRWHFQQERSPIPKSVRAERIAGNFDIFTFELSAEELAQIDAPDTGVRGGPDPDSITLETFRRPIPEVPVSAMPSRYAVADSRISSY